MIPDCVYKPENECTPEEIEIRKNEYRKCAMDFSYWYVNYVKLVIAPTRDTPGGVVPVQFWEHLKQLTNFLQNDLLISVLKARQVGVSWLVAADALWGMLFKTGFTELLFSKGESESIELLAKTKRIYKYLPDFMKLKADPDSTTEMGFPDMMSSLRAMVSTESAGISFTASKVVCDEHIEHPYAIENYKSAKPTIDAGGQFISIFTSNENKLNSLAVSLFQGGLRGENGFKSLFIPYTARPGRDEKWYQYTMKSTPNIELQGLSPEIYMHRCYPLSIEEALSPTQQMSVFIYTVLDTMKNDCRTPLSMPQFQGNIYKDYMVGAVYIAASDTGHGAGLDSNCTVIMNVKTGEVIADIFNNNMSVDDFAYSTVKLLEHYRSPLWFPEYNDWGHSVVHKAEELGYTNFGMQERADGTDTQKLGWKTTGGRNMGGNRVLLWGELIPAINSRQITIYNLEGLKTFYDIIRNTNKEGRIEAKGGGHDDYPMAVAIAWYNRNKAIPQVVKIESYTYRG